MPRPILCTVDPSAVAYNIDLLKKMNSKSHCMAVVKANGYGHGLEKIFPGLEPANSLALLELESARLLRQLGWAKPIMLLEGCFDKEDLQQALLLGLDMVVHHESQLSLLESSGTDISQAKHKPKIYLKVNTGMNRLGFTPHEVPTAVSRVQSLIQNCHLPLPVLTTHFANADGDGSATNGVSPREQYESLMSILPHGWQTSLGNSAGALNWQAFVGDYFRPGISIYGATPGPKRAADYGLRAAMALTSQVISIQHVGRGEAVGYGSRYIAQSDRVIAVVACGYADGYPRHAPDGTPVWLKGRACKLAGRVSMDMLTVDVTGLDVHIGEHVELWGGNLAVDEVAQHCGTIGYELLCAVTKRVPFLTGKLHG